MSGTRKPPGKPPESGRSPDGARRADAGAATTVAATPPSYRPVEHDVLLAALPHPILVITEDDRIIYANAAAEVFCSASIAMLKRQKFSELVAFGSPLTALVEQVRRHGASVNEYKIEVDLPRAHARRLVDVYGSMLTDQPGCVFLMLQHRAMAQLIERQLTHRAAARSMSGMASVLAHEIKNPLSGIRGAAQLLEPGLNAEDKALAQLICAETDRIRDLVDRMEVFGDERPLQRDAVNIHAVLDHVRRIAEHGFARGVRVLEEYDPSLPAVYGNRDKLVQVFLNLLKNAIEALPDVGEGGRRLRTDKGRIVLRTAFRPGVKLAVPGSSVRISLPLMIEIEDNGSGIPEHLRGQLFDPFVTTKRTGTGLGLALVAKIIADHGGTIECESLAGRTIFRVLLPMQS